MDFLIYFFGGFAGGLGFWLAAILVYTTYFHTRKNPS